MTQKLDTTESVEQIDTESVSSSRSTSNNPLPKDARAKRSWWRFLCPLFSLRTMLAVITILCILLATWILPSIRQYRAVCQLEAIDGFWAFVSEDVESNAQIKADRGWYEHLFNRVDSVQLHLTKYPDPSEAVVDWAELPHLKQLHIIANLGIITGMHTPANIDWLVKQLASNQQLSDLIIIQFRVSDEGMKTIAQLHALEKIYLYDCFDITDDGLRLLLNCKKLKNVTINHAGYKDETIKLFRDHGIKLE